MTIHTQASETAKAKLYWDTGEGFNERESVAFVPYVIKKFDNKLHKIEITRLPETNPKSLASEVWIENIFLDGNAIDLNSAVFQGKSIINDSRKLAILEPGATIQIEAKFEKIDIDFFCHQWAGKVQVSVDGKTYTEDLFSANTIAKKVSFDDGALSGIVENKFALPQLNVKALKMVFSNNKVTVDDISVTSGNGTVNFSLPEPSNDGTTIFMDSVELKTKKFHIFLFLVQIFTAALITTALFWFWAYLRKIRQENFQKTLSYLFFREHRWFFWVLFTASTLVFFLWLLGQWPGIMTVDSYHYTWREIKTFQFQNVTPWVYNLYVLVLTQLYDSPIIVGLFQIIATSLLGSMILYYCYKKGARKWIVIVSAGLFATSIPIGIYNITIWKDIPFNTIILFWGFFIFRLYYKRKYENTQVSFSVAQLIMLSILLFLVCTLRHNGIVFVVAIPVLLFIFKLIPRKNFWHFAAASCILFLLNWIVTPMIAINTSREVSNFFSNTYKVAPLAAIYTSPDYFSPTKEEDQAFIHKWLSSDELKKNYTPVPQADKINYMISKWSELNQEEQARLKRLYFVRSLQNPHIFLADRIAMMLGTMGLSSNVFITTNALRDADTDKSSWRPIEAYKFTSASKVKWLEGIEKKIIGASTWYKGELPLPFFIFNTLLSFLVLVAVMCFFKIIPGSALYCLVFLYSMPFLFIALSTAEWRYLYFLLLGAHFVFPIISMENQTRKSLSTKSRRTILQ
jgi:hypothetical protein